MKTLPSIICKNNSNLVESGEKISDTIAQGISKGFIAGPFNSEPLDEFRSNTLTGIKQKDKLRLEMDLPRSEKQCYNENVIPFSLPDKFLCLVHAKLSSFSQLESGHGAVMSKHDGCLQEHSSKD